MSGFFGIIMSSLQPAISSSSLTSRANEYTSTIDVSSTSNNRGTLSYSWQLSGKTSKINAPTSAETTITGLDTDTGSTVIYCNITDSVTGVTTSSPESVITWTDVVYQNIAISGTVTYNGAAQEYTLTGSPELSAPSGRPSTFTNAGTYTSDNITISPGSGYTLGTVSGSFTINPITITDMSFTLNGDAFTSNQSRESGTSYTIAVSSTTPTGGSFSHASTTVSDAGSYTLSSSGSGNYHGGPFTSPVLTLTRPPSAL